MDTEAAAKVRLDIATAALAAQSLGKGRSEPKKTQEPDADKDSEGKVDEKIGINQFLASIAEECDRTSVQANPLFFDILKKSLGKLFGLAGGDGVHPPMGAGADPLVQAINPEAKAAEQAVPDDDMLSDDEDIPAPTSPPPPAEPQLQPSERQLAAELSESTSAAATATAAAAAAANTISLEAPTTLTLDQDAEAKWAEEMDLVERTKRNNEASQAAAEGSTDDVPRADQEPSIKRAKGDGTSSDLSAHDILLQVAKVQLAAARKDEVHKTASNDVPTMPLGAGASGSSSSSSTAGPSLADALQNCG